MKQVSERTLTISHNGNANGKCCTCCGTARPHGQVATQQQAAQGRGRAGSAAGAPRRTFGDHNPDLFAFLPRIFRGLTAAENLTRGLIPTTESTLGGLISDVKCQQALEAMPRP